MNEKRYPKNGIPSGPDGCFFHFRYNLQNNKRVISVPVAKATQLIIFGYVGRPLNHVNDDVRVVSCVSIADPKDIVGLRSLWVFFLNGQFSGESYIMRKNEFGSL